MVVIFNLAFAIVFTLVLLVFVIALLNSVGTTMTVADKTNHLMVSIVTFTMLIVMYVLWR